MAKNKFKIGDKVQIKRKLVKMYREYLTTWFLTPVTHELREHSLLEFSFWLTSYLSKDSPKGNVISYGSEEDPGIPRSKLMVEVSVTHMGEEITFYTKEESLKKC